jgi:hypothetical protein
MVIKTYKHYKIIGLILAATLLIIFGVLTYSAIRNSQTKPLLKAKVSSGFHSPNKIQLDYGQGFQVGNIGVELFEGNSSFNADQSPIQYGFNVWYINSLNSPQTASNKALSIGCIAQGNQSFKTQPSVFSPNLTSLSLNPFQVLQTSFQVSGNCQYIGTADGKYWWNVPVFGD